MMFGSSLFMGATAGKYFALLFIFPMQMYVIFPRHLARNAVRTRVIAFRVFLGPLIVLELHSG